MRQMKKQLIASKHQKKTKEGKCNFLKHDYILGLLAFKMSKLFEISIEEIFDGSDI